MSRIPAAAGFRRAPSEAAPTITALSLGAGVQSSTCLLLACRREIAPFDVAIFADTGWEPQAVYRHLDRLERLAARAGIPIRRVRRAPGAAAHPRPAPSRHRQKDYAMTSTAATAAKSDPVPSKEWTPQRIRALGLVTDLPTAAAILGLSRNTAYTLARQDRFPVPVLRAGRLYRVSVPLLLATLGLEPGPDTGQGLDSGAPPSIDHTVAKPAAAGGPEPERQVDD